MNDETKNQPIEDQEWLRPLTMEEIDAMLDEAEADFAAGLGIPSEVVFRQLEEDFAEEDKGTQTESIWKRFGFPDPLFSHRRYVYRSVIINGLSKLVYYVDNDSIYIAAFWDTRREPKNQADSVE